MATPPDLLPAPSPTASAFLEAVAGGRGGDLATLYDERAIADMTVPGWRSTKVGPEAIGAEYARWFADPGHLDELRMIPTGTGVVLTYLLTWEEAGVPHAAHHCHVLDLTDDRITHDTVFCGGRWPADLLAEMEEAARVG